ncbi:MAG: hypothetical protein IPI28_12960 [Candidatus Omnitrophica bacterium]|nr:hypothetical protein [Candidatus Omnitrophota bacterium]
MVASPRYTQNLKLPPPSIDMTTVKTLSNSYTTYQIVISRLRTQAGIINSLHDKIQSEDPWAAIAATSATEAANLLGWPLDESFREAWADLPPAIFCRPIWDLMRISLLNWTRFNSVNI